ncbi:hypothetical protein ACU4GD_36575 [Cupriavidus basilensis]
MKTAIPPKLSTHTAPARKPYWALLRPMSAMICGENASSMLRSICASKWITIKPANTALGLRFQNIICLHVILFDR